MPGKGSSEYESEQGPVTALGSVAISVLAGSGGFRFDRRYYFDPAYRWAQDQAIARWTETFFAPLPLYYTEAHLVQLDSQPLPFRQVGGLQPNLILAAALGAELAFYGDHDPDSAGEPLRPCLEGRDLLPVNWETREPVRTFLSQIDALTAEFQGTVDVFPPFFWDRSGRATVHGPLTTAVKLCGNGFFVLLEEDPSRAQAILLWIADAYTTLITLFSERAALPVTGIHIGECAGGMVSPAVWEGLLIPAMNVLADATGPVRMHSCGRSDHLLTHMAAVNNLGSLNIGSGTSIARARTTVGPDVKIDVIPDTLLLTRGSSGDVAAWVEATLEENAGGPLEIQFHLEAGMPRNNAKAVFDTLARHGHPRYEAS